LIIRRNKNMSKKVFVIEGSSRRKCCDKYGEGHIPEAVPAVSPKEYLERF
jgi:hypothetical protein